MTEAPEPAVDLLADGEVLLAQARDGGRAQAVRLAFGQPGQRSLLLGLPAGGGLPDHDAPGPASLVCLAGEVVLSSEGRSWTLPAGSGRAIPQARHDVRADVDSICLLTVSID
ncbi:hypothetical protein [Knoellia aerolata]|uniref:Cupin n=1 Tax=Knoellia aerolata DSM 18566 TaxID=1385519 RepID=A0A0A0JXW5_9MICO|nr:hypothetical protein [Knoellia aerolata]KGN41539.1 hypothetical protein N801_06935 [Knoellia aerolata DSM 18566]